MMCRSCKESEAEAGRRWCKPCIKEFVMSVNKHKLLTEVIQEDDSIFNTVYIHNHTYVTPSAL